MNVTDNQPAAQWQHPIRRGELPWPLNDRVLVYRLPDWPNDDAQAILTPQCAAKPSRCGAVVRVGPGRRDEYGKRRPLAVRPGDVIYFGRYTDYDDGRFVFIQEADIVGVVDDSDIRGVKHGKEREKIREEEKVLRQGEEER